jgi:hypothetical protein
LPGLPSEKGHPEAKKRKKRLRSAAFHTIGSLIFEAGGSVQPLKKDNPLQDELNWSDHPLPAETPAGAAEEAVADRP